MSFKERFIYQALAVSLSCVASVHANEVEFSVQPDRSAISLDESVSLKILIKIEGSSDIDDLQVKAPDFDVINEFNSTFIESYYENGRFGMRNNRTITRVLRPRKEGNLTIGGAEVRVNGKKYTAPSVTIRVSPAGTRSQTQTPQSLPTVNMQGKRLPAHGFFMRAEVDKQKVYKGEQVTVGYYLYFRVRTASPQVDKFPELKGFLREDLDMPVVGQQLPQEQVMVEGVPYQRALLAKYAVYPLKTGKLRIDSMGLKLVYYSHEQNFGSDDPIANFFQNMVPGARNGTTQSEPIPIEVSPLPEEGRPSTFTGGIGNFEMTSSVDKAEVRANEAITVTLRVEGKGNGSMIEEPKVNWPEQVELYESKARSKLHKNGVSEKIFEFLLIPREPGKLKLPPIELSYFDPEQHAYVTKTTQAQEIQVLDGLSSTASTPKVKVQETPSEAPNEEKIYPLRPPVGPVMQASLKGHPVWRWLYWMSLLGLIAFLGLVTFDHLRKRLSKYFPDADERSRQKLRESKSWQKLRELADKAAAPDATLTDLQVIEAYERLSGAVYDSMDRAFGIGARSWSRSDLERLLVEERGLPNETWNRASQLLEFAEAVRFASSARGELQSTARQRLRQWVDEGHLLEQAFMKKRALMQGQ